LGREGSKKKKDPGAQKRGVKPKHRNELRPDNDLTRANQKNVSLPASNSGE